jgi:hypothetical protein
MGSIFSQHCLELILLHDVFGSFMVDYNGRTCGNKSNLD